MFSHKQETKIAASRTGVSAALALTPGNRARIGMCVFYFSLSFAFAHLPVPVSIFQPSTRLLPRAVTAVTGTPDSSAYTPTRRIGTLSHNITARKHWAATVTGAIISILRRTHRFRHVPSNGWVCELCQYRRTWVTS